MLTCSLSGNAQPPSREYQLKAVFLYNFTQFVEWPAHSFSSAQEPMIIGILGKDPFGSSLEEAIAGETVNGHPLAVRRFNSPEEIGTCHILFVNISDAKKLAKIIAGLQKKNILTVSDAPDFLKQGGMVKFLNRNNKIKLQVNLEATKAVNLIISSKLLRLVEIFEPSQNS